MISIISLLIALLLPSLAKARAAGQTAKCQANVRGFVQAVSMYTLGDNQDFPTQPAQNLQMQGMASDQAGLLLTSYYNHKAMVCPSAGWVNFKNYSFFNAQEGPESPSSYWRSFWQLRTGRSGYNIPFGTYSYFAGALGGYNTAPHSFLNNFRYRSTQPGQPSRMAMVRDWDDTMRTAYQNSAQAQFGVGPHRQNPGASYGFVDGHVKWDARTDADVAACLADTGSGNAMTAVTGRVTPFLRNYGVGFNSAYFTDAQSRSILGIK